jgi:magnesium-transporting ATPase (P-type)
MNTDTAAKARWHAEAPNAALETFSSDRDSGLSASAAAKALESFGPNQLPAPGKRGPLMRFLMQMNNMLIYVLLIAGVGKVLLGEWIDAAVILGVVLINSLLGFVQEGKAEKALDSIRNMLSPEAKVLRDGKQRIIPAEDLVPGDIVLLQSGDKVPADLRLFDVKNLRIEEAALTGESVPTTKQEDAVTADATIGDRRCMAFSSTLVVSGRARGVVVGTGSNTEIGHINQMLSSVSSLETPLLRQIEKFGKALTAVILIVCALTFAYGALILDKDFVEMFKASVGIAVAAIPEGLPAIVTITLALGVQRMAKRHAIIRRLPAVETLGSVSRICSDKTGTLTRNEMVVTSAVTTSGNFSVTGTGYDPAGEIQSAGQQVKPDPILEKMALACVLCNEAHIDKQDDRWVMTGDPTEGALLPFAIKAGLSPEEARTQFPRINSIPFESEHKFMASLHRDGSRELLLVKGAPDVIFGFCDRQESDNGMPPPAFEHSFWEDRNTAIASQGNRVLALAWLPDTKIGDGDFLPADLPRNLVFLGLVGIIDPPREEAIDAVQQCHEGGIRVTMITGDHAITAASIAKMLGIGDGKTYATGKEIEALDDDALEAKCRRVDVFARTSPEHKLRLVRAMQANGQVVAMTGDGVNDAPALKQADVGVAMGIKGTEVSKEAAEMVLADDNFASITAAVKEGRTVFNNIEKAILFMLPTNGGQSLTILAAIIFGLTLPVTPPQILWVNMVSSITLALAISFEPHEWDVMRRPPREVSRSLLDFFGIWRIIFISLLLLLFTFGTFFYLYNVRQYSIELCRTTAINALIIGQIFYLINSRFLLESCVTWRALAGNRWIPLSILGVLLLQILFTYAPFMQTIFGTAAVPLYFWGWLLIGGIVFFFVVELEKFLLRTVELRKQAK